MEGAAVVWFSKCILMTSKISSAVFEESLVSGELLPCGLESGELPRLIKDRNQIPHSLKRDQGKTTPGNAEQPLQVDESALQSLDYGLRSIVDIHTHQDDADMRLDGGLFDGEIFGYLPVALSGEHQL